MIIIGFLVILGLVLGSFATMLTHRLVHEKDPIIRRSHCPSCSHPLGILDLIPLVSYLYLKGSCRYCHARIPYFYWAIELLMPLTYVIIFIHYELTWLALKLLIFMTAMIILFFTDLLARILPNPITIPLILLGLIFSIFEQTFMSCLWGTIAGFGIYFLIGVVAEFIFKRPSMGGGDMKLGAAVGAFWGLKICGLTIYLSFILGGILSVFLILFKLKRRQDYIPFGPSIILAYIIIWIYEIPIWTYFFPPSFPPHAL